MSHIFGFHKGHNNNILGWERADRIVAGDINEITDKTDIISSSAGSSIPTPVARMFLFKAAFDFMSSQMLKSKKDDNRIYAGLISETLDLLELLFKSGSNTELLRYENWVFNWDDGNFFGKDRGHRLLAESFKQAAAQQPFNRKMEVTLIYYRDGGREILAGGTSPFTFVFTSPNFKRKKGLKEIFGLTSDEPLFTDNFKQLWDRDSSFIWYVENLVRLARNKNSFEAFTSYVANTRKQYEPNDPGRFISERVELQHIQCSSDIPLSVSGIPIEQISEKDYQLKIEKYSDFKLDLPAESLYRGKRPTPLFLYSHMDLDGQYTSPTNYWSKKITLLAMRYPATRVEDIYTRILPGLEGIKYPFLSKFDFFEKALVMLPGYKQDDERFSTLIDEQDFLLPIKPLFFNFFPLSEIKKYVKISRNQLSIDLPPEIIVQIDIPIDGSTMGKRIIPLTQTYKRNPQKDTEADKNKYPFIEYMGIIGIFPFIKTTDEKIKYINKYTIAAYEKTIGGDPVSGIEFIRTDGEAIKPKIEKRSELEPEYVAVNTKTAYYQVDESFDLVQLNFLKNFEKIGGFIIPLFKPAKNGTDSYVYGIDFGTSNTHVEYAQIASKTAVGIKPFEINNTNMIVNMLNKPYPIRENDTNTGNKDYLQFGKIIDSVKVIIQREFVPFQIGGDKSATTRFPFRTATFESTKFKDTKMPKLFIDANIGFNIDKDLLINIRGYETNLKWELESNLDNLLKQSRVQIFFRQLLLMVRSHAILSTKPVCDLNSLKIAMSFPNSMDKDLTNLLKQYFTEEMKDVFGTTEENIVQNSRFIEVTESIAPYYQLLQNDPNIKHKLYCNIDVGGGTSDIVLVKNDKTKNILNCFCNSVKFAGKQLWGSMSDDDFDINNNGFILFFFKHLQSVNHDDYNKLRTMIGQNHLEDIVSYLFNDDKYNFKRIFTECKELKVPLLLHYAALLYFIAKICKHKPLDLPTTLSFSGKGSEYISIIFSSDEHLRLFTKTALSLFSGLPANPDFNIKKSGNPKVITAQGSVIYGAKPLKKKEVNVFEKDNNVKESDEPLIFPVDDSYYGLKDIDTQSNETKNYKDFQEGEPAYESVLSNCVEFLETFFGNEELIKGCSVSLGINNLNKYREFFIPLNTNIFKNGVLRNSYLSALEHKERTKPAADSPFFFAFNTSLIELSKFIAREDLKKKGLSS